MADIEERMEMELPPQEDSPAMFETEFDAAFPTAESVSPAFDSNFIEEDMVSEQFSKPHDLSAIQEEKKEDEPEDKPRQTIEEEQDDDDDDEDDEDEEDEEKRHRSRQRKKSRSRRNRSKKSMPEDATPQELYAIGAVFEHLYRGGSPSKCIRVYQKEMSRAPELSMFGRGVYRRDDDDWTYNDVDTVDDNGTSYMSVDETTIFSSSAVTRKMPEKPWDEESESAQNTSASRIAPFLKNATNGAKAKFDLGSQMWSEMAGMATKTNEEETEGPEEQKETAEKQTTPSVEDKETSRDETNMAIVADEKKSVQNNNGDEEDSCLDDILGERDEEEEEEETKPSSDPNESSTKEPNQAKENEESAEKDDAKPAQDEESQGPGPAVTMEDVKALVGMFRKTIANRLPEDHKSLQAALARAFSCHGRSEDVADTVQELKNAVETDDPLTEQRPLNHLAKKMQSIAMKEPTQTFAISEQDQIVEKEASSLEENVGPEQALQREQSEAKAVLSLASEQNSIVGVSNTSLSGGSKANSEDVGSHRGDTAASISSQPEPRVPTSIQTHTIARESGETSFSSQGSDKAQITFVGVADPSPRQNLPPMPPTKSSAPLPAVCVTNDSDATEMGVIDSFEVRIGAEKKTVTPPRPTKKNSSKFLKRFSFRKNKETKAEAPKKEESPRSAMMVDSRVFQSSRDNKNLNDSADACIGVALADALVDDSMDETNEENMIVKQLNFEECATTNGVLMTQTNDFAYEVESV